jgi:hypothetical protein
MSIGLKTRKILWGKSGNRCAICRTLLYDNEIETDNPALIGEECHIVAKEENGPRGNSSLSSEERDFENNLILLCCNHHTIIDTETVNYTVEKLHTIKSEHEEWVKKSLNIQIDKSLLSMCVTIEKWETIVNVKNWTNNFGGITYNVNSRISKQYYNSLKEADDFLLKRFKINTFNSTEEEFDNFRKILHDLIQVFNKYIDWKLMNSDSYITELFYKIDRWDPEMYNLLLDKYNFHVRLINDLTLELTRSANRIIELIRENIDPSYFQKEGKLMLHFGADINLMEHKIIPIYQNTEKYNGLKDFCLEREKRKPEYDVSDKYIDDYV